MKEYRKQIYSILKGKQSLKVTGKRLYAQARMIRINGWLTRQRDRCNPKKMMNENAGNNYRNVGSGHDDQGEDTENESEDLENVCQ